MYSNCFDKFLHSGSGAEGIMYEDLSVFAKL